MHITTAVAAVVMLLFFISCQKKDRDLVYLKFNPETTPTMVTDSVSAFVSDSGVTRYKIVAKKWMSFDRAKDPYRYFPKGLYVERYDPLFRIEATVVADTAWNYTAKKLWKLKGNVKVKNIMGDEFESQELFWDEQQRKVYSDKLITIRKGITELKGYGFESNQEMTEYRIFRPYDGKIPFDENPEPQATDTQQMNDSISR